jgi:hypothetical protein
MYELSVMQFEEWCIEALTDAHELVKDNNGASKNVNCNYEN